METPYEVTETAGIFDVRLTSLEEFLQSHAEPARPPPR